MRKRWRPPNALRRVLRLVFCLAPHPPSSPPPPAVESQKMEPATPEKQEQEQEQKQEPPSHSVEIPGDLDVHRRYMSEALAMAESALTIDEVPVGCVFVHNGNIIGRGRNDTNRSLCGTRHAEFVAIEHILHTYPPTIFPETDLYVTVEPCVMCASALRQLGIRHVFFGCMNDRFGGCGGVLNIHLDEGVDRPFPAYGGIQYKEAIMLLRRFYIQENERAPRPLPKKNRVLKSEVMPFGTKVNVMGRKEGFVV